MYTVIIQLVDGTEFTWQGEARSQYRAEVAALAVLRANDDQQIQNITTTGESI